jgi:hypothetical protein
MQIVARRLDDASLVPNDPPTHALVMRWVSWELHALALYQPAAAVARTFLERFPMHRDAPVVQWEEIVALGALASSRRPHSPEAIERAKAEAEARARLTGYVGDTPWTQANKADDEALQHAAALAQRR